MPDMNVFLFATNIFVFVLCGGIFMIVPQLTRDSYLFGVKIPKEQAHSHEAKAVKMHYVRICLLGTLLLLVLCVAQFIFLREATLLAALYFPLMIIPIYFIAFVSGWKRAQRLKEECGWQVSNVIFAETRSSHTRGKLSALPWGWYAVSLLVVIAAFLAAIVHYPVLPDMIPGHFGFDMQPTRFVQKTWTTVLLMPIFNASLLALMILAAALIEKAKLQIDPQNPRLSFAQHSVYRWRFGHAMGFFTLIMSIFMALMGLPFIFLDSPLWGAWLIWGGLAFIHIPIVLLIVVYVKTGQGGCKVKIDIHEESDEISPSANPKTSGQGDDKYWLFGMFYHNPDDPAYFIESRFGTNFSPNYARLPAKIGTAILILGLIATYVWVTVLLT